MTDEEVKQLILDTLEEEIQDQDQILSQRLLCHGTGHEEPGREEFGQQDGPGRQARVLVKRQHHAHRTQGHGQAAHGRGLIPVPVV